MPTSSILEEPQLAPPGAGLPTVELWIGRLLFTLRRWRGTRETFTRLFQEERAAIGRLVDSCPPHKRGTRVLIPRPRGLEDSSRSWSVWMTLDHLRIVNHSVSQLIAALAAGRAPPGKSSTARVKPSPSVTEAVEAGYEKACDDLQAAIAAVPDLRTRERYSHAWFGPLDALGWHAMTGMHMGLHRKQIGSIVGGL